MKYILTLTIGAFLFTAPYFVYTGFKFNNKINEYNEILDQRIKDTSEFITYLEQTKKESFQAFVSYLDQNHIDIKAIVSNK